VFSEKPILQADSAVVVTVEVVVKKEKDTDRIAGSYRECGAVHCRHLRRGTSRQGGGR
jgi:hypothetical protein